MNWFFQKKNIVVLDLGSDSVKIAEFSINKKIPFLESFVVIPIPDGVIDQGDLKDVDFFVQNIPNYISKYVKNDPFDLYVCINGRPVIVKKMEILKAQESLRDTLVHNEIQQNLPWNLEEINWHYFPMDAHIPTLHRDKMNILLVAAKVDVIKRVNEVMSGINKQCVSIDMGCFSVGATVEFIAPHKIKKHSNILVLDIGKLGTVFTVLHRGNVIFSRYIVAGSNIYTVNLMRDMEWNKSTTEGEKKKFCYPQNEMPVEVVNIMAISDEYISNSLFEGNTYFKNQFPDEEISYIYVTGGGSKMKNLIVAIQKKFNAPAELLKPFTVLKFNSSLKSSLSENQHFISSALGTCLRGVME